MIASVEAGTFYFFTNEVGKKCFAPHRLEPMVIQLPELAVEIRGYGEWVLWGGTYSSISLILSYSFFIPIHFSRGRGGSKFSTFFYNSSFFPGA